jgi:hypothetical protein
MKTKTATMMLALLLISAAGIPAAMAAVPVPVPEPMPVMEDSPDMTAYEAWVFSSNANTTLYMELSMDTGLGIVLRYRCDDAPLSEGWQTIELKRSEMRYD